MNKQTKILAGVLAAVVLLSAGVLVWRKLNPKEAQIAKITQKGQVLREIDLTQVKEPYSFVIEGENGALNTVQVEPGRICISEASCRTRSVSTRGGSATAASPSSACPIRSSSRSREEGARLTQRPVKGARRVTRLALLTAIALTIFMVEAQIPVAVPIPGVKLGLANIVTVYTVFALGAGDALLVLVSRVFLGAVFSGQMMTLLYSLGGGLLCWLAMVGLRRLLTVKQLWLCSPLTAICHNLGQLLVAAGVMKTWAVLAYLPYLVIAGAGAGLFTGCAPNF